MFDDRRHLNEGVDICNQANLLKVFIVCHGMKLRLSWEFLDVDFVARNDVCLRSYDFKLFAGFDDDICHQIREPTLFSSPYGH